MNFGISDPKAPLIFELIFEICNPKNPKGPTFEEKISIFELWPEIWDLSPLCDVHITSIDSFLLKY